ncbi:tetratricopeptide repeat protein [Thiohalorhabdus sp.]|uniref:tetratricopeptide repeat protein n=1 Tax=Thiohalorhabdus sp. TaxID=3094134 RepID=UPI002FC2BA1F
MSPRLPLARFIAFGLLVGPLIGCQTPTPSQEAPAPAAPETSRPQAEAPYRYALFTYLAAQLARQGGHPDEAAPWFARTAEVTGRAELYGEAVHAALKADNGEAAATYAKRWRKAAPDEPKSLLALARARVQQEDAEGAAEAVARLVSAHPRAEEVLLSTGKRLAEAGGVQMAMQALRGAGEAHSDNAAAHLAYGHFLTRLRQQQAAVEALRRARELRPEWQLAVVQLAQALPANEGLAVLRDFLAGHPDAFQPRLRFAQGLLATDRPSEAEQVYTTLAGDHPEEAEVFMGLGLARFHQEKWVDAAEAFRRVLVLDPGNNAALYHLGRVAEAQEDYAGAAAHYSRVHSGRYTQEARLREAMAAVQTEDLERALQLVRQLRAFQPEEPEYYRLEARIMAEMDQVKAAEKLADRGLDKHPQNVDLLYTRALIRDQRGDYQGMEADIRRVIEQRSDEARAYNFLGYSLADRGVRLDEALELIRKANDLEPEAGYILDSLGWVYYRMGKLDAAERNLRHALKRTPDDPKILAHLGEVLEARDRPGEARQVWQQALEKVEVGSQLGRELRRRLGEGQAQ